MKLNNRIEHTLLNPEAKWRDLRKLCNEAKEYNFRSVCVNPEWVYYCKKRLGGTNIKVVQVYQFPTSVSTLLDGDEIDIYLKLRNISRNKRNKNLGKSIINKTLRALEAEGITRDRVKVIIETRLLSPKDITYASGLLARAKVGWIKSSTGLFKRINQRKNIDDLNLIKKGIFFSIYKPKIKMAGGIRTTEDAETLIKNGADLVGCSKSIQVVK